MSSALRLRYNTAKAGIVTDPRDWATSAGYEFWCIFGNTDILSTTGGVNDGSDGYGWTYTGTLAASDGSAGDFLSSADADSTKFTNTDATEGLASPRIFGSYAHALQASRFLGYMPTKLTLELYARFLVITANNTTDFFGMTGPAVVDCAAAGSAGAIRSGGTASTYFLTSDNGSDAGAAVDGTVYHHWKIEYGATNTEWFIDGVSQGTITTEADIWPQSVRIYNGSGTNDHQIAWVRVFYS